MISNSLCHCIQDTILIIWIFFSAHVGEGWKMQDWREKWKYFTEVHNYTSFLHCFLLLIFIIRLFQRAWCFYIHEIHFPGHFPHRASFSLKLSLLCPLKQSSKVSENFCQQFQWKIKYKCNYYTFNGDKTRLKITKQKWIQARTIESYKLYFFVWTDPSRYFPLCI